MFARQRGLHVECFYNHDSLLIPHLLCSRAFLPAVWVVVGLAPSPMLCPAAKATFAAIRNTYLYLTPDLWTDFGVGPNPYQEHSDFLSKPKSHKHKY